MTAEEDQTVIPDSKTCVYCGKRETTKEHFWGKWSRRHAPRKFDRTSHSLVRFVDGTRDGRTLEFEGALNRPGSPRSQSLRIACADCNNGWMSNTVKAAEPILTRMGYGYWGTVTAEEATALARWIAQFTMSQEFSDRETVCIPQHVRSDFAKGVELNSDWLIAIGYAFSGARTEPVHHRAFRLTSEDSMAAAMIQCSVFLFGKLICLCYHSVAGTPERLHRMAQDMKLSIIHPAPAKIEKPYWMHDDRSVALIIEAMTDAIRWRGDGAVKS